MPFQCRCLQCLQYSPDGREYTRKDILRQHAEKYGTVNSQAKSDSRVKLTANPSTYTRDQVQDTLDALLHTSEPLRKRQRLDGSGEDAPRTAGRSAHREPSPGGNASEHEDEDNGYNLMDFMHNDQGDNDHSLNSNLTHERLGPEQNDRDDTPGSLHSQQHDPNTERRGAQGNREHDAQSDPGDNETPRYHIADINISRQFISGLQNATLDELDPEMRDRIHNPPDTPPSLTPAERFSLDVFLGVSNASEQTYESVRKAYLRRHPDEEMLSHYQIKSLVRTLSGVTPVMIDMCCDTCTGFTGPFADLRACPYCGADRYTTADGNIPRKQFPTFPLAPQLQALWRSASGAKAMQYRRECTEQILAELKAAGFKTSPYRDLFDGSDYIEAVLDGRIKSGDMVLMMSIDGAQLYRMKASDCWIYIWVIMDLSPSTRYQKRHVLPGGIVPGPNKPKNLDSFMFPGLHHLSIIQRYGLTIWDGRDGTRFSSHPFLALVTADGPAMASISGCVGHHGKHGCRFLCPITGRHKAGAPQYYPALLRPDGYSVDGCDHPDVSLPDILGSFTAASSRENYHKNLAIVEASKIKAEYEKNRLETGIVKPSIFLGLPKEHNFGIPAIFPGDNMHLPCLNITDLFIPLWRGKLDCDRNDDRATWDWVVLTGDQWKEHGQQVAACTPYIPGSFDRPPRNPAEKISSGYKAWEYLLYFYGLGPALFHGILPDKYYRHYCKGVQGMRIMGQEEISTADAIEADTLLTKFCTEFEELYCQRKASRLHFSRQSMHTPAHMPHEVIRRGPGGIYSQWVMERTIGNLGEEIKQHADAFSNLGQRALRRCQVNALLVMWSDLDDSDSDSLPRNAVDLNDGYALLPACDTAARQLPDKEMTVLHEYFRRHGGMASELTKVSRWARLRLPNGQTARCAWKESSKPLDEIRAARHVKVNNILVDITFTNTNKVVRSSGGRKEVEIAEVLYYLHLEIAGTRRPVAMVYKFGAPDSTLMNMSCNTYWTAERLDESGLAIVEVKDIQAVVMMAPDKRYRDSPNHWFLMEKPGLKLISMVFGAGGVPEDGDS